MTTSILFTHSGAIPVPNITSIPVASGSSFELAVSDGRKAIIYFSPALAAIVTPAPAASVTLSPGSPAHFTFTSEAPGAYSLIAAGEGATPPTHFRTAPSSHVSVESDLHSSNLAFPVDGGRTASNN